MTRLIEILLRKKASDKLLCDNAFNIAKNPKYDDYQRSPLYGLQFFYKKSASFALSETLLTQDKPASGSGVKSQIMPN